MEFLCWLYIFKKNQVENKNENEEKVHKIKTGTVALIFLYLCINFFSKVCSDFVYIPIILNQLFRPKDA